MNPQFHIQIPRSAGTGGGSQSGNQSNTTGGPSGSSKCHVVVSVTQVNYVMPDQCSKIVFKIFTSYR